MKRNFIILTASLFAIAGCQTRDSAPDETDSPRSGILNEPAGAQSYSSDVNPAGSARNVGQSGATTNQFDAPVEQPPQNDTPQ